MTKKANILFTYELAERLEGTGVVADCVHPGGGPGGGLPRGTVAQKRLWEVSEALTNLVVPS